MALLFAVFAFACASLSADTEHAPLPTAFRELASKKPSCFLPSGTLCRALHDRPVLALTIAQSAVLFTDGISTRRQVRRGYQETDPFARLFIGRRPTWARMAPMGTVQVVLGTWLAERMKTSRNRWIRRFWWMPQTFGIAGNTWGSISNLTLRHP